MVVAAKNTKGKGGAKAKSKKSGGKPKAPGKAANKGTSAKASKSIPQAQESRPKWYGAPLDTIVEEVRTNTRLHGVISSLHHSTLPYVTCITYHE